MGMRPCVVRARGGRGMLRFEVLLYEKEDARLVLGPRGWTSGCHDCKGCGRWRRRARHGGVRQGHTWSLPDDDAERSCFRSASP